SVSVSTLMAPVNSVAVPFIVSPPLAALGPVLIPPHALAVATHFLTTALETSLGKGLRKVYLDATIVNEDIVHLAIGLLTGLPLGKLYNGIAQTAARPMVPDHFATGNVAKAGKDHFQVVRFGQRIQLAHKQDIFRRLQVGRRPVTDQL